MSLEYGTNEKSHESDLRMHHAHLYFKTVPCVDWGIRGLVTFAAGCCAYIFTDYNTVSIIVMICGISVFLWMFNKFSMIEKKLKKIRHELRKYNHQPG